LKSIPVFYRSVQPFPPEYFRQEITFYVKLRIAGRYLLRQGLIYPVLYFIGTGRPAKEPTPLSNKPVFSRFLPVQNFSSKSNLWAKTRAEHGSIGTEEAQTLLFKKDKIIQSKTARQDFISNSYYSAINRNQ
jgi:hypothetical protein